MLSRGCNLPGVIVLIPPRPTLKVERLADHFGQYVVRITCTCGHTRQAHPKTLAAIAGWDARLVDVVKRLRCSKCGKRGKCAAVVRNEYKRDERK